MPLPRRRERIRLTWFLAFLFVITAMVGSCIAVVKADQDRNAQLIYVDGLLDWALLYPEES